MDRSRTIASGSQGPFAARIALLTLAVVAVYWPALNGPWLWDDVSEVTQNPTLRDGAGLLRIWFHPPGPDYFPLKSTFQWLEFHAWGLEPLGYHLASVALHLLSAFLLWRLLGKLGLALAWFAALLFAVHPLCVESVAWIAEQKNTLSMPLVLGSLLCFVEAESSGKRGPWIWSGTLFLLSLLAKTSAVGLPVVLVAWRLWRPPAGARRSLVPFFAASLVLGATTVFFQSTKAIAGASVDPHALPERVLLASRAVLFYAGKSLLPIGLMPAYPAWPDATAYYDLLLWGVIVVIALLAWRARTTGAWVATAAFGAFVAPILGVIPMSWARIGPVSDHFAYLALVPAVAWATAAAHAGVARMNPNARRWAAVVGGFVALALAGYGRHLAGTYASATAFWSSAHASNPASYVAAYNYGNALRADGQTEKAAAAYQAACLANPAFALGHSNLADMEASLGRGPEAVAEYRRALALDPTLGPTYLKLSRAEAAAGHAEKAAEAAAAAAALDPHSGEAHHALGFALLQSGNLDGAAPELASAARLDPSDATALSTLGMIRAQQGRLPEAIQACEEAVRLEPANPRFLNNLGNCRLAAGDVEHAMADYQRALVLDPHFREAQQNLELARARASRP